MLNAERGAVYFWFIACAALLLVVFAFYQRGWVWNFIGLFIRLAKKKKECRQR